MAVDALCGAHRIRAMLLVKLCCWAIKLHRSVRWVRKHILANLDAHRDHHSTEYSLSETRVK